PPARFDSPSADPENFQCSASNGRWSKLLPAISPRHNISSKRSFYILKIFYEFCVMARVQRSMSEPNSRKFGATRHLPAQPSEMPEQFSFALRRYTSRGPRRLFIPQKPLMSPVFQQ